ncbi:MAG: helix-turn-helix transcriptional regulator [Deltaproteobacteria bacterium]|nr:helix-turn-helix transcriptional regulator [Deltaproteobacteria bacterium]
MARGKRKECAELCPIEGALAVIGGKWKLVILWHLLEGSKRYGELKRAMPEVSEKMLIQQLRELESDKILARKVYAQVPPRVEYSFTAYGETLKPVLRALVAWGGTHFRQRAG